MSQDPVVIGLGIPGVQFQRLAEIGQRQVEAALKVYMLPQFYGSASLGSASRARLNSVRACVIIASPGGGQGLLLVEALPSLTAWALPAILITNDFIRRQFGLVMPATGHPSLSLELRQIRLSDISMPIKRRTQTRKSLPDYPCY